MIGGAVFRREALAQTRHPRSYVFQTLFLAGLVLVLVPLWPAGNLGGSAVTSRGRDIFYYGTFLELVLIALIAPTVTASAITSEKDKNTLDLLLLTDAGPFAIVFGKLCARVSSLAFVLFLSLPVLFALLTLGGVDARLIGVAFGILLSTAWLGGSLGIFLSTLFKKTTGALIVGYALFGAFLASPLIVESGQGVVLFYATGLALALAGTVCFRVGTLTSEMVPRAIGAVLVALGGLAAFWGYESSAALAALVPPVGSGTHPLVTAYLSAWYDLDYLFRPQTFVTRESFPARWWVNPLASLVAGGGLAVASALLLPASKEIGRTLGVRQLLDAIDSVLARFMPARASKKGEGDRGGPKGNPIYWKETTVNTLGRFRHWWRVNLVAAIALGGSYYFFRGQLNNIVFHKMVGGALSGLLVLAATMIAATSVAKEREDRTLFVLATTPIDCPTYVKGKVQGIFRNILFLMLLPFIHVSLFIGAGTIGVPSLAFVVLGVPIAAISAIVQGTFVSLVFPTQLKAILAAILVVLGEALLPFCCCLPTFNPVLLLYYGIEAPAASATAGPSLGWALFLSSVFSLFAHILLTGVIYSLIRSGFDRYIGRAG